MKDRLTHITRRTFVGGASASLIACAAPRRTWSKTTADVIVIGAGLAGLHAASQIEKAGYKVIVLEGAARIGGRLHNLDDLPGRPDAGGIQVGASYKRFHAIADRLNVARYSPPQTGRGSLYHIGGKSLLAEQWPTADQNKLATAEKETPPDRLFFSYLKDLPKLKNIEDWMRPSHQKIDIALREYLLQRGASDEALRLINANLNGNDIAEQSALHMARSLAIFRAGSGPTTYVRGGSQRMTDAMANALRSEIILNSAVAVIEDEGDGVELGLTDGRKFGARHVICTAPFAVMRAMRIEADLPSSLRMMISQLPYTKASFAYLEARSLFWKKDGLPQTIWSDDPLLGRMFVLGEDPAMVKVWLNGKSAERVDQMDEQSAGAEIVKRIEQARPSARGQLKFLRLFSWQKNPFARGIYHHIGAGQGAALAASTRYKGARLHFAGEHLAQQSSGMEGALESAERSALYVLKKL
ncbi:MAG: FAD-dependent oxidoreductase [Parasphingorhabdus sp.]|uniref:flavin monoamine oxidase family protein n=1 Tax=Parasphingorhabdus sp. TaxID=2709688 RepID=UPI00329771EA